MWTMGAAVDMMEQSPGQSRRRLGLPSTPAPLSRVLVPLEGRQLAWLFPAPGQPLLLVFAQGWGCRSGHCPRSDPVGAPRSLLPSAGQALTSARCRFPLVPQGFSWLLLTVLT